MAIRLYRAYSPGTRSRSILYFDDLTKSKPEKSLTFGKKGCGGRNNRGIITLRGRGGGHKRKYRLIDFKRTKDNIPEMEVEGIEFKFGVGGETKQNSSSWILKEWKYPTTRRVWGEFSDLFKDDVVRGKELIIEP